MTAVVVGSITLGEYPTEPVYTLCLGVHLAQRGRRVGAF